ncbi:MAG TPA: hypothetical protein VF640_04490 [Acidimicrobiales bacterium]|jgi:prephenate dehydratase
MAGREGTAAATATAVAEHDDAPVRALPGLDEVPGMPDLDRVRCLRTLGPTGTNLEAAAHEWLLARHGGGRVLLHRHLDDAVAAVSRDGTEGIVACAVYPDLHALVFDNHRWMVMADCFLAPTFRMVLASRGDGTPPRRVASHGAPVALVPAGAETVPALSNSAAAAACRRGDVDACITTATAADANGLDVLEDHGPVPMVYTVHVPRRP